ncbi:MAG TPA: alpha/beta hydrolase [Candidatus Dormibacteraeota bacterium]|nr:alpha/beta hydrolase [Candidatus Dormibacteraeota bacterium]
MFRRLLVGLLIVVLAAIALPPLWFAIFPHPAPELPPAGRLVEVAPGVHVNVLEEGSGQPVVLVHGHPATAYDWEPLMHELAVRGRLATAYDRVGYGRSDGRRDGNYTVAANADELLGLLAAEQLEHVVLVGWSYGGGTAIAAAHKDPSRIDRLVLIGSVGPGIEHRHAPPAWVEAFMRGPGLSWLASVPPVGRRFQAMMTGLAFSPEPISPGYLDQLAANFAMPHTLQTYRSEGGDLGSTADIDPAPINRPILVVHGEDDHLVPTDVGRALHERAPQSQLWLIPHAGHMLPLTRPGQLADHIVAFADGRD